MTDPPRSTRIDRRSFISGAASLAALGAIPRGASAHKPVGTPKKRAKNLIFAVADGCGPGAITLGEHFVQMRDGRSLNWTKLLKRADTKTSLIDTASANGYVTDSAAAASAWAIGELVNNRAISWTPDNRSPRPLLLRAQDAGRAVGIVSNTYIWDATTAAWLANAPDRKRHRLELAEQLVESSADVMLGGGRGAFDPQQLDAAPSLTVVRNNAELTAHARADGRLLGLFAEHDFEYQFERNREVPELAHMARVALDRLRSTSPDGFALVIEGAKIDHAAHANDGPSLVTELAHFDDMLGSLIEFTENDGETLLIVTSDHANANPGLTYYGPRGRDAFPNILKATHSLEWITKKASAALGPERNAQLIFDRLTQASGLPLTAQDHEQIKRLFAQQPVDAFALNSSIYPLLGSICAHHTGLAFLSPNHTSDPVYATALGPGSELFGTFMPISQIHHLLVAALGLDPNP